MYRRAVRQRTKKKRPLSVNSLDDRSRQSLLSQLVDMSTIGAIGNTSLPGSDEAERGSPALRRSASDISTVSWGAIYRSKSDGISGAPVSPAAAAGRVVRGNNSVAFSSDLEVIGCDVGGLARQRAGVQDMTVSVFEVRTADGQSTAPVEAKQGHSKKVLTSNESAASQAVQSSSARDAVVSNSFRQRRCALSRSFSNGHSLSKVDRSSRVNRLASCSDHNIGHCNSADDHKSRGVSCSGRHPKIKTGQNPEEPTGNESMDIKPNPSSSLTSSSSDRGKGGKYHNDSQRISLGLQQHSRTRLGHEEETQNVANYSIGSSQTNFSDHRTTCVFQAAPNVNTQRRRNNVHSQSSRRHSMTSVCSGFLLGSCGSHCNNKTEPNCQRDDAPCGSGEAYASFFPIGRNGIYNTNQRSRLEKQDPKSSRKEITTVSSHHKSSRVYAKEDRSAIKMREDISSFEAQYRGNLVYRHTGKLQHSEAFWLSQDMARTYPSGSCHVEDWLGLQRDVLSVHEDYFQETVKTSTTVTRTSRSEAMGQCQNRQQPQQQQQQHQYYHWHRQRHQENVYETLLNSSQVPEISLESILLANSEFVRRRMAVGSQLVLSQVHGRAKEVVRGRREKSVAVE